MKYKNKEINKIGTLITILGDLQNQNKVYVFNNTEPEKGHKITIDVTQYNIIQISIYFSVRHCTPAAWLNDRDQFLYPNDSWQKDTEFQNDCLAFTLFNGQNKISANGVVNSPPLEECPQGGVVNSPPLEGCPQGGVVNHWIPFTEQEVNAKEKFDSNFMTDFIKGKATPADLHLSSSPPLEGCPQGGVVNSPHNTVIGGVVNSPHNTVIGGVVNSPHNTIIGGVINSPHNTVIGGVVNSPHGEVIGGVVNSPHNTVIGGVVNSPHNTIIGGVIYKTPIIRNFVENLPYNPKLTQLAKDKRKAGILSEVLFWQQVHKGKFHNIDFDRQRIIGNYIVDFYVKTLGLIIEIDGSSHDIKIEYDGIRQAYLESFGLKMYRIKDIDVKKNLINVMSGLENYIIAEYEVTTPPGSDYITPPVGHTTIGGEFSTEGEFQATLFNDIKPQRTTPLVFSPEAKAVFEAGQMLWRYYHAQKFPSTLSTLSKGGNEDLVNSFPSRGGVPEGRGGQFPSLDGKPEGRGGQFPSLDGKPEGRGGQFPSLDGKPEGRGGYNPNASLFDIRQFFQGRNSTTSRMNNNNTDDTYTTLKADLKEKISTLANKIKPKIYKYQSLKAKL